VTSLSAGTYSTCARLDDGSARCWGTIFYPKPGEGRRGGDLAQRTAEKQKEKLDRYWAFCQALGEKPADVALAWLLANPVVTAPIIGPRTEAQLDVALRALEIKLDAEAMKKLDEIFPGPGGAAPEAYAW
jgi:aryl-alcohol dehydrogenase-like predicted oxidoreductase